MKNNTLGKISSALCGLSVLAFAISMVFGTSAIFASCLSSTFIALSFVPFMIALYSKNNHQEHKACGLTGVGFAIIYAVIIFLVYYAECTTVRMNPHLSAETLSIISYGHLGSLFFNYDLLGYSFMALSTFLMGLTIQPKKKSDKVFKAMLMIHGVFFLSCFFVPMFPIFTEGSSNAGDAMGTILLEIWCAYFLPICVLGYRFLDELNC